MGVRSKVKTLIGHDADTPWTSPMSDRPTTTRSRSTFDNGTRDISAPEATVAAFSPDQQTATRNRNRAVLIHQKSPLLTATPPQVTRALTYSHPFILPLNALAGLISWTTGDPWESFLFVASFWFVTLYADSILRWFGPIVAIGLLVSGMHSRKFSPLSSSNWTPSDKQARNRADSTTSESQQRKSLDEILETLRVFSNRCDVLLDPFLQLTDFLGTQATATSATTRPALTSMFLRLVAITPLWIILGLPLVGIITTTRIILVAGTIGLTWHSTPARASRTILWRSYAVRYAASLATGLHFAGEPDDTPIGISYRTQDAVARALRTSGAAPGVRFTFAIYENQRRWVALGFSNNLFPSERQAWTEEHNNPCPSIENFPLPDTDSESMSWQWVASSEWKIDPSWTDAGSSAEGTGAEGWTFYDNKWKNGSKVDDWSKWTRRRRWIRDAELVEIVPTFDPQNPTPTTLPPLPPIPADKSDAVSLSPSLSRSISKRKGWFGSAKRKATSDKHAEKVEVTAIPPSTPADSEKTREDDDVHTPLRYRESQLDRSIGEGLAEQLS